MANSLLVTASAVAFAALACSRSPAHPCAADIDCAVGWTCQNNFCTKDDPRDAGPRDVSSRDSVADTPTPDGPGQPDVPASTSDGPGQPDVPTSTSDGPSTPDGPATIPDGPGTPDVPATTPDAPDQPDVPATTPDAPSQPDVPATTPDAPSQPDVPPDVSTDVPVVRDSPWNYMFVTSMTFMPNFGSLEAADRACDDLAASARLPGSYRAWLSTSTVDARDRLEGARGWVRADGAPFADTPADVATGYILNAPYVDESGRALSLDIWLPPVITGTLRGGIKDLFGHCQDWRGTSGSYQAGTYAATTRMWTEAGSTACSQPARLYCFGVDKRVPLTRPAATQRRAFLSDSSFAVGGGLAAADAVCARDAVIAGLPPNFKALLPTSQASAASRFPDSVSTVWVRLDGVPLNAAGVDLFKSRPLAPLNVTSRGAYSSPPNVLTGSTNPQEVPAATETCADWTNAATGSARVGFASYVTGWWNSGNASACSYSYARPIYCFEDGSSTVDGGAPPPPADPLPTTHNFVFTTALTFRAQDLTLAYADQACGRAAVSAGLPGTYRAWLSSPQTDARDRLSGARGWIRTDGAPFADTIQDLIAGRIFYPPARDEYGIERLGDPSDVLVATATRRDGTREPGQNCPNLQEAGSGGMTAGSKDATTARWTSNATPSCGSTLHLYCFGVDKSAAVSPGMAAGKLAFVTDGEFARGGGVSAADSRCNSEAQAAGLSQRFKALVATSTASAASRFSSGAGTVWVRPDGIAVNRVGTDIFKGQALQAPINVSASKQYVGDSAVLAGAPAVDMIGSLSTTCNDWQATGGPSIALLGHLSVTSAYFGAVSYDCTAGARVYCLEE